jgi:hypothetical protein
MGGACSAYKGEERCVQGYGGETEGKRPLWRPRSRQEMDLQDVGCRGMDWIALAQNGDRWRALVTAVMNLRVL